MNQAYAATTQDAIQVVSNWRFQKTVGTRFNELKIPDEREELRRQWQLLEYERQEFLKVKAFEEQRLAREKHIFNMEWQMLEEGWRKLASERESIGTKRPSHGSTKDGEASEHLVLSDVKVSVLFSGVKNLRSLRKRYKDLIKIFHPDNMSGDTGVIQRINEEYELLKRKVERIRQ